LLSIYLLASCAGQETGEAKRDLFLNYQTALRGGDVERLRILMSSAALAEMEQSGVDIETAIETIQTLSPPTAIVQEPLPTEDDEKLILAGSGEGFENAVGKVSFVREAGEWKISRVSWEIDMSLAGEAGYSGGVASIWDPRYEVGVGKWWDLTGPRIDRIDSKYLVSTGMRKPAANPFLKDGQYVPRQMRTMRFEDAEMDHAAFSVDGSYLVTAGYGDYIVRFWDAYNWSRLGEYRMNNRPTSLAVSPRGDEFVTGDVYSNLNFWPLDGYQLGEPTEVAANAGSHLAIAISDNAMLLATVSWDQYLSIWDLESRELLSKDETSTKFRSVAFSPAGPIMAAGLATNSFVLWDLRSGKGESITIPKVAEQSDVSSIAFSPDGKYLLTGHSESSITMWDVKTRKQKHDLFVRDASTLVVRFSPGGEIFASGHQNGEIYLWDTETAHNIHTLKGHNGAVRSLAFSPDGMSLVSTGEDNTMIVWQ
jgi:WD40 repeat protein